MDLLKQLNWRYAVKEVTEQKLSDDQADTVFEAIRLTASSGGLQPYKLIVVEDHDTRVALGEHSYKNKGKVVKASHLLVFAIYRSMGVEKAEAYVRLCARERGVPLESLADFRSFLERILAGFASDEEFQNWAMLQAFIALGNFLTSCAVLGIDACPMEGFAGSEYDRILGLEEMNLTTSVIAVMGYRDQEDVFAKWKKVRWPMEDFLIRV